MGADFLKRAAPSFKKCWDEARVQIGTADLFARTPDIAARTVRATIIGDAQLTLGECVIVEKAGDRLVARRRLTNVAEVSNPPPEIVRAIEESCGIAKGTIEQIHPLSGVVEVSLC